MTSRKKGDSPVEVIDLCEDDDAKPSASTTAPPAATAASTSTSTNTTTFINNNPKPRRRSSLSAVRKRVLHFTSSPAALNDNARRATKKVKTEGKSSKDEIIDVDLKPDEDDDDGDVEVVDNTAAEFSSLVVCPPVAAASASANGATGAASTTTNNDEDVQVVGTVGQVLLPHLREDCTEKTFDSILSHSRQARANVNSICCERCYCYVCDKLASECTEWQNGQAHCNATSKNHYWKSQRQLAKTKHPSTAAASTSAASSAYASASAPAPAPPAARVSGTLANPLPDGYHFRKDCMNCHHSSAPGCSNCFCWVCNCLRAECSKWSTHRDVTGDKNHPDAEQWLHVRQMVEQERHLQRVHGSGPFPPDNVIAQQDTSLTACRKCHWYNKFEHRNFLFFRHQYPGRPRSHGSEPDIHKLGILDWCHKCGRVASENDFGKEQSKPYTAKPNDVFLGTKTIPFRIKCRDPREIPKYRTHWEDNQGKPEWVYNEKEMQQELFCHRIGEHPTLNVLLRSIPVVEESKIPTTSSGRSSRYNSREPSLHEMDAVLVGKADLLILAGIKKIEPRFASSSTTIPEFLDGDIAAAWNDDTGTGTLTVRVFIKKMNPRLSNPLYLSEFFGTWFGVFPMDLVDVCGTLRPRVQESPEVYQNQVNVEIPPFKVKGDELENLRQEYVESQELTVSGIQEGDSLISLHASDEDFGGTCTNETDFAGIMKRFVRESLPDIILHHAGESGFRPWIEYEIGRVSSHRNMSTDIDAGAFLPSYIPDPRRTSILSPTDLGLAVMLRESSKSVLNHSKSINTLLGYLVNLGHGLAPPVEGLNVELLPFQLQSLQWALERETVGLQSFWCAKLPHVEEADTELYLNPILGTLSNTKPSLVRGGIMAEMMGLGKTVISLSLILCNPAPTLFFSGAASSTIPPPSTSNTTPFWDPDLSKSEPSANKKRGSILCRGTLVVCNVSLVGQWIDEAKSKLKNPGLVYSYHGAKRKRDPHILCQNAIVVTTYETLASDATYHAKKGGSDYCPPCEQIRWWRIIADEAHVIRNASSKTEAVMDIVADHKWLVSGTPVNTSIGDLGNQLKFLGIENSAALMKTFKQSVCLKRGRSWNGGTERIGPFAFFMRSIMMRHTQDMVYAGTNTTLMSLPPMTERVVTVPFSSHDQKEYNALEKAAQSFYEAFRAKHWKRLGRHYLVLKQKLMPLRVACSGGQVPIYSGGDELEKEKTNDNDHADGDAEASDVDEEEEEEPSKKKSKKPQAWTKYAFTSKLNMLVKELKAARDKDPTSKSLVFSQFTSTLKWLQQELPRHGFQFRTLSGEMSMSKRSKALREFQNDPPTTIFLLSMRAGAVGINLTQANRVFIMEPCLNPAVEAQAIGRVHRLGQKRPVEITRLVMQDSVETRIRQMLEEKYGNGSSTPAAVSSSSAASGDNDEDENDGDKKPAAVAAPGTTATTTTTTTPAVVGCLRTEKTVVLQSEFDLMYGVEALEDHQQPQDEEEEDEDMQGGVSSDGAAVPDTVASLMSSSI